MVHKTHLRNKITRYVQSRKIWKPTNLKDFVLWARKPTYDINKTDFITTHFHVKVSFTRLYNWDGGGGGAKDSNKILGGYGV